MPVDPLAVEIEAYIAALLSEDLPVCAACGQLDPLATLEEVADPAPA